MAYFFQTPMVSKDFMYICFTVNKTKFLRVNIFISSSCLLTIGAWKNTYLKKFGINKEKVCLESQMTLHKGSSSSVFFSLVESCTSLQHFQLV